MAVAAALVLRVGGVGRTWLPGPGALFVLLAVVHAIDLSRRRRPRPGWRALARTHRFAIGLTMVIAIAVLARWPPSLGSDLGHQPLDIDEARLASSVRHFFVRGEILHETVEHYPGLVFWLMTAASLVAYLRALMSGAIPSVLEAPIDLFVLAARMTNVWIAVGTVAFTALIGRTLSGSAAGLVAALVVAVVPLSVQTTTAVRNDPGQVLFITAAVWAALVLYQSDRRRWAAIAGALAGIAAAIKYSSVFALVPAIVAAAARGTPTASLGPEVPGARFVRGRVERVAWVLAGFILAVAATNHFLWSDFPNFIRQLSAQIAITGAGHWAAMENPAAFYMMILGRFGPGWPLLLLAAAFGVYGLSTRRVEMWIFWAFPLLYIPFMTGRPAQFPRWVYPLVPFVAVAGASGLMAAARFLRARGSAPARPQRILSLCLTAALVAIALLPPAWSGAMAFSQRLAPPTHAMVETWLREHASPGDAVLLEIHWLNLAGSELEIKRVEDLPLVLNGGQYHLFAHDWIVVPEPYFGNPALRRLSFVRRFHSDQTSFFGNLGYDFEVYAAPKVPPSIDGADVRLDSPEAAPFLGPEWRADSAAPGLALPAAGASLFLPVVPRPLVNIELEITGPNRPSADPPISLAVGGTPVVLEEKPSREPGRRVLSGAVRIDPSARGTEIRLQPVQRGDEIRIARLRIG
jgi:4-amino-4-deoxy-L-arabinose transferase-like glycosyltransferase